MSKHPDSTPQSRAAACAEVLSGMLADPEMNIDFRIRERLEGYQHVLTGTMSEREADTVLNQVEALLDGMNRLQADGLNRSQALANALAQYETASATVDRVLNTLAAQETS